MPCHWQRWTPWKGCSSEWSWHKITFCKFHSKVIFTLFRNSSWRRMMATKSESKTRVRSRQTRIGRSTSASGCFSTKSSQGRLHSLSFARPGLLMLGNCSVGFAISGVQFRLPALSTALISLERPIHWALFPVELCHPNQCNVVARIPNVVAGIQPNSS